MKATAIDIIQCRLAALSLVATSWIGWSQLRTTEIQSRIAELQSTFQSTPSLTASVADDLEFLSIRNLGSSTFFVLQVAVPNSNPAELTAFAADRIRVPVAPTQTHSATCGVALRALMDEAAEDPHLALDAVYGFPAYALLESADHATFALRMRLKTYHSRTERVLVEVEELVRVPDALATQDPSAWIVAADRRMTRPR